jgi:hypothetical protein
MPRERGATSKSRKASMKHSVISHRAIDADAGKEVVVITPDKRRYKALLTADEVQNVRVNGQEITTSLQALWVLLKAHGGKLGWAAFLAVATGLAFPAVSKQWSDRQAARAIQAGWAKDMSEGSVSAFTSAQRIATAPAPASVRMRQDALDAWTSAESKADATVAVYAGAAEPFHTSWEKYRDRVFDYVAIACCDEAHRAQGLKDLHTYISERSTRAEQQEAYKEFAHNAFPTTTGDPWSLLRCGSSETCRVTSAEYATAYKWLGLQLLRRRGQLVRDLNKTHLLGFSRGTKDLLGDIVPFVG